MILNTCTDSCNHHYNQDTGQSYHPPKISYAILLLLLSHLPPYALAVIDLSSIPTALSFQEYYTNGIILYETF